MPIKRIEVFETSDGQRFASLEKAERHQASLDVSGKIKSWVSETWDEGDRFDVGQITDGIDKGWETLLPVLKERESFQKGEGAEEETPQLSGEELKDVLDLEIEGTNIPTRAQNALTKAGYKYLGDFAGLAAEEVTATPGLGEKSAETVRETLQALGIGFGVDVSGWESPELPPLDVEGLGEVFTSARYGVSFDNPATAKDSLEMLAEVEKAVYARLGLPMPVREKLDNSDLDLDLDLNDPDDPEDDFDGDEWDQSAAEHEEDKAAGHVPRSQKPDVPQKPPVEEDSDLDDLLDDLSSKAKEEHSVGGGDLNWDAMNRSLEEPLDEDFEDEEDEDPYAGMSASEIARVKRMEERSGKAVTPAKTK